MTCPEMERLIESELGQLDSSSLEAHVQTCEACRVDLLTIRALAGVGGPERELSEALIAQIISGLPEPEASQERGWGTSLHLCLTWGLGFLTALVSVVATGSTGSVRPSSILFLAMGFGAICTLSSLRARQESSSSDGDGSAPEPA